MLSTTLLPPSRFGSASGAHSAQCYRAFHPAGYGSCSCPCSACCRSTDNRYTAFPYSWLTCAPAAAAVSAVEKACKQSHRFGIVRPACFGFQNPLHQFKLLCRNDCFMGVVHDYPVPHRHVHFLFRTIIQSPGLSLHHASRYRPHCAEYGPLPWQTTRLIALAEMQAQLCAALQLSRGWRRGFLCIQTVCDA